MKLNQLHFFQHAHISGENIKWKIELPVQRYGPEKRLQTGPAQVWGASYERVDVLCAIVSSYCIREGSKKNYSVVDK